MIIIAAFLFYLFNEMEDACVRNKFDATRLWWNAQTSWKFKYARPLRPYVKKWYHFGTKPAFEERFPYSTTAFVFLTDGEHLSQFLKFRVIEVAMLLTIGWMAAVAWIVGGLISRIMKELIFKHYE